MIRAAAAQAPSVDWVERLCVQAQRMRAIPRLSAASRGDPERLMAAVCALLPELVHADGVAVFVEDGQGLLRVRAAVGFPERFARWATLSAVEMTRLRERSGPAVSLGGPPSSWPCPEALMPSGVRSAAWVAIEQRGRVAGGLFLGRSAAGSAFSDDDCLFCEVLAEFLSARLSELAVTRRLDLLRRARLRDAGRNVLGELCGGAGAVLFGPTQGAIDALELAATELPESPTREAVVEARAHLREAERTTRALALFDYAAISDPPRAVPVEEILAAAATLAAPRLEAEGTRLDVVWEEDLPLLRCRPAALGHALLQLIANARDSLNRRYPDGGEDKCLRLEARNAGGTIELEVWDGGVGLSQVLRERLAEPGRSGAGLAACREAVASHGGTLAVDSEEGGWARFVIALPLEVLP